MVGEGACAQALQGLQGLRQRRERARAAFGGGGRALFAAEFSARRLLGFDLFQNELFDAVDGRKIPSPCKGGGLGWGSAHSRKARTSSPSARPRASGDPVLPAHRRH
jgi:hypothetical protein